MRQIWVIAKRELNSFFNSLMAYIMIVAFLGFSGFFAWLFPNTNIFLQGEATLQSFFGIAYWSLFFFIPALTMGQFAEENKSGTIELLVTKPVTDWQIVNGKFLSTLILIGISLLLTFVYYITVASIGSNVDHGAIWTGYLGLLLISGTYVSIGLFASSVTNNQIVAFLLALLLGILFHLIFGMIASSLSGIVGGVLNYLSVQTHFESISRGVIDTRDIIYFGSVIFVCLFSTELVLAKRNIAD